MLKNLASPSALGKLYFSFVRLIWPDLTWRVCQIALVLNTNVASNKSTCISTDPISSHTQRHTQSDTYKLLWNHSSLVCRFGINRGREMGKCPGICSEIMGFMPETLFSQSPKNTKTPVFSLDWQTHKVHSSFSSLEKEKRMWRKRKQQRRKRERSRGLCGNLCIFITKMGLLKSTGGGEREEEMAL